MANSSTIYYASLGKLHLYLYIQIQRLGICKISIVLRNEQAGREKIQMTGDYIIKSPFGRTTGAEHELQLVCVCVVRVTQDVARYTMIHPGHIQTG